MSQGSPGLVFGNVSNPMTGVVFDNVEVVNSGSKPFGTDYYCEGAAYALPLPLPYLPVTPLSFSAAGIQGFATESTSPKPPCFKTLPQQLQLKDLKK